MSASSRNTTRDEQILLIPGRFGYSPIKLRLLREMVSQN